MIVMWWMGVAWLATSIAIMVLFLISRMSVRVDAWLCGAKRSATAVRPSSGPEPQDEMPLAA